MRDASAEILAGFMQGKSDEGMESVRSKFEAAVIEKQSERRRLKRQKLSVESSMVRTFKSAFCSPRFSEFDFTLDRYLYIELLLCAAYC